MNYTKTNYVNDQAPATDAQHLNNSEQGIFDASVEINDHQVRLNDAEVDIVDLQASVIAGTTPDYISFNPISAPTSIEGRAWYDQDKKAFIGRNEDHDIIFGEEIIVAGINLTGAVIPKGSVVRTDSIQSGIAAIELASATSFDTAWVTGITAEDVDIGERTTISHIGAIKGVPVGSFPIGTRLYLSETPGAYTKDPPAIVSQVGIVTETDSIFTTIRNLIVLPTIHSTLSQPAGNPYNAGTTQVISYAGNDDLLLVGDPNAGTITITNSGKYKMTFTTSFSFTSLSNTRVVNFSVYNNGVSAFTYTKNIPRDATADALSFSFNFSSVAGDVISIWISGASADYNFTDIAFDIESVNILQ